MKCIYSTKNYCKEYIVNSYKSEKIIIIPQTKREVDKGYEKEIQEMENQAANKIQVLTIINKFAN